MAIHSSTLAWKIPWTEEPGRLQSMGSGHNSATSLSLFTFMHWRRKWPPIPALLPGEPHGRRSLVGYCSWGRKESDTTERLHYLSIRVLTARAAAAGPSSLSLLCPVDSPPPSPPQGFSKTARYLHFRTTHPKPWKWRGRLGPERRAPSWQDSKLCLLRSLRLMSPPSSRPLQLPNPQPRPHRPRTRRGDNRKALPAP